MTISFIKPAFAGGEFSPSLFSRVDLQRWHTGVATMRNMFVNYRGGASSRAGTMFVGASKQAGTASPPRLIPFRFSATQNYTLEFGEKYLRIVFNGGYVIEASFGIASVSHASPATITTATAHGFSAGDWVYLSGINGPVSLNGRTFIVASAGTFTLTLTDICGNSVSSAALPAYVSGGSVARIYTVTTPYAAADLPLLKFAQSADVMSLCHPAYPIYDLKRVAAVNWTMTTTTFVSSIAAPASCSVTASTTTGTAASMTTYQFCVTAVSGTTGDESQATPLGTVTNSVDISVTAGSLTITWASVPGARYYNVYKGPAAYGSTATVPVGSIFGYAGFAYGNSMVDTNITPDSTKTPPLHSNPFAPGQVLAVTVTAGGATYVQTATTATVSSGTGSGCILQPVVTGGAVTTVIVINPGTGYTSGDAVTITGGNGAATATMTIGAQTGTNPSLVAYFQQRRVYANTLNQPDTYFMSQPGSFTNHDSSIPINDGDAIIGTPWATQVNGIAALVPMPGGLVVLTGGGAWQLSGGGQQAPVTPSRQDAQPQAYNGCSPIVPPIPINFDIIYVQQKGSIVYDLSYNFFVNIYTGTDLTIFSSHLFLNNSIREWAWSQEPHKVIWTVRDDGVMLSLTYLKEQEVQGWARHDTQGQFVSVCSISEPPVDAIYVVVKRFIQGAWRYYIERMDNRLWQSVEDCWCVDCGLALPRPTPAATLSSAAASGAAVAFTTNAASFLLTDVGSVIRSGGGKATITSFVDNTTVICNITVPITKVMPSKAVIKLPFQAAPGKWTMTAPVTSVSGLDHLEGQTVSILADGGVVSDKVVTSGGITLPQAASAVTVGLSFQAQLQSLYLDIPGEATVQGKRKNIYAVTIRTEASRGVKTTTNQPDASTQPFGADAPWTTLVEIKDRANSIAAGTSAPLFTGDLRVIVPPNWRKAGQVAVQQDYPLPLNITGLVPETTVGDDNG